jgi:hypothetical protein
LLLPRESAPTCEAVRWGASTAGGFPSVGIWHPGFPTCSTCRPTSVNSGVAHPIFEVKYFLKLLATRHPLFSANLRNRGLRIDLFTGLLVMTATVVYKA